MVPKENNWKWSALWLVAKMRHFSDPIDTRSLLLTICLNSLLPEFSFFDRFQSFSIAERLQLALALAPLDCSGQSLP